MDQSAWGELNGLITHSLKAETVVRWCGQPSRDVKVPVGIHKGSEDGTSFFMLLQPIFDLIEELHDEDFVFCSCSGV
jgi:hypothetical protein